MGQPTISRDGRFAGRVRSRLAFLLALVAVWQPAGISIACAQNVPLESLAEQSTVVVRGRVLRLNASDDPTVDASSRTAIVSVLQMYAGNEIAGDQRGHNVTVILSRPDVVRSGQEAFFFGNVRSLGNSMTIADRGEIAAQARDSSVVAALQRGVQMRRDRPIRERLAAATLVFRGTVENVRPLETRPQVATRIAARPSEHDPEWQAADVRIVTPFRGGQAGQVVTIVFAASRDIMWFNSPKLTRGQDAIFLAHTPNKDEQVTLRASGLGALVDRQTVYLVTEPYDVLPPSDEARVRALLSRGS